MARWVLMALKGYGWFGNFIHRTVRLFSARKWLCILCHVKWSWKVSRGVVYKYVFFIGK